MRERDRLLTALVLTISVASGAAAQNTVTLGAMIGGNSSKLGGDDAQDISSRTGFLGGGFLGIGLGRHFAIRAEGFYAMKGTDAENPTVGEPKAIKFEYIQVPVLGQIRFPTSSNLTPYLIVGPSLAFKLSCKVEIQGTSGDTDCDDPIIGFDMSSTDFSLVGGGGIEIAGFTIDVRYDYGLTKVDASSQPSDIFNRAVTVTLGYGIRLGPKK